MDTALGEIEGPRVQDCGIAVRVVYSDASETGYSGYVVEYETFLSHGCWTAEEGAHSSTWQELSTVYMVLLSVALKFGNALGND